MSEPFRWRLEYRLPGDPWDGHGVPYHSREMAMGSFEAMSERVCPGHDVRLVNLATGEVEEQHAAGEWTCDRCGHELHEHDDPDWTGMVFCRVRGCDCSNYVKEDGNGGDDR